MEEYSFAKSTDLEIPLHVRISSLDGPYNPPPLSTLLQRPDLRFIGSNTSPYTDLYVTIQLWADSKPWTVPVQTAYKSFKNARIWNEWLELPIRICTLPQSSQLAITVWDISSTEGSGAKGHAIPFGGTTIPVFDNDGVLQRGQQRCRIYRHTQADPYSETKTPSIPQPKRKRGENGRPVGPVPSADEVELERLEKLFKKHELGEIPRVDWLDQLVFRAVEKKRREVEASAKLAIKTARKLRGFQNTSKTEGETEMDLTQLDNDEPKYTLIIEFQRFDFPIVYTDFEYEPTPVSFMPHQSVSTGNVNLKPPPEVQLGPGINGPESGLEGDDISAPPLIRIYDPEVGQKDNPAESKHRRLVRSHRTGILDRDLKPNAKIRDELNTIMSYGPTQELKGEEVDLVWKFRHHLTKDKRALTKFVKSVNWHDQSEAKQAVQILPKWTEIDIDDALELLGPSLDNPAVRAYAVDRLRESDDDELLLYLLQLVQALKFEKISPQEDTQYSSLAKFLISRATKNLILGNYLHWYLMVECDDRSPDRSKDHQKLFAKVEYDFMSELMQTPDGPERRKTLLRQGELITVLSKISKDVRFSREDRPKKAQRLRRLLADPKNELISFDPPLPLPLDPNVSVIGVYPEDSMVFKSSLFPLLINFKTSEGKKYPVMFKTGDDLRQDQLVIQIISLMDRLLRKENLDLKLTPYRILATSPTAGAVQFIPSISLAAAWAKHKGSILAYLRTNNPDAAAEFGVRPAAMETYVKSCAGYCVITYLLGVGDRHLDNLLLTPDGHFFHIDFGYLLGRDPKPFAPAMKLCREMIEGMGGASSPLFTKTFKQYCYTAFTTLRKQSNLILNLFALMVDANIQDIRLEPDKAVLKVRERFALGVNEEEAVRGFEAVVSESVGSVGAVVIDRIHDLMQGLRA
ncbi:MAG: hypothetical protein Q9219_004526 [cf. Caloplaca sp. 3 TL-2023]